MAEAIHKRDPAAVYRKFMSKDDPERYLEIPENAEALMYACRNVCDAELNAYRDVVRSVGGRQTEDEIRGLVVGVHWMNPLCATCHNKNHDVLYPCELCTLQFYCSEECEEKHWSSHKEWCCKKEAPFDRNNDPYRPVVKKRN